MEYYLFFRYTEQVSIGDKVLVLENANLTPATVVNISTLNMQGDSCCDMGQNDTIGKIELNPSFVLSSDNTNCKNDIQ